MSEAEEGAGVAAAAPDDELLEPETEGGSGGQGDGAGLQEGQRLHVGAHEVAGAAQQIEGEDRGARGQGQGEAAVGPQAQAKLAKAAAAAPDLYPLTRTRCRDRGRS